MRSRARHLAERFCRGLARSRDGNSAVEFALIAPVLAILLIGLVDVGSYAYQRADMFGAVRAGAQYFMAGGSNLNRASDIVVASWSQAPDDAVVLVDRYCQCLGTVATCNVPCADSNPPATFSRISVSATFRGILMSRTSETTDTVRIR